MSTDTLSEPLPRDPLSVAPPPEVLPLNSAARREAGVVGWGIFVTNLGQTAAIGLLPLRYLLKDYLHFSPEAMAGFLALVLLPWNFKVILGLISDNVPLFGTRRRHYLMFSSCTVAGLWILLGTVPRTVGWLLGTAILLNVAMVMASVVVGGVLVECGQKYRATGRLASVRLFATNIAGILTGFISGYLASRAFGWTCVMGAAVLLSLAMVVFFFFPEARSARANGSAMRVAWRQLIDSFRSPSLWIAAGLIFMLQVAPGFQTPLFYYQTNTLHFQAQFIGYLLVISSIAGIIGSFLYAKLCKTINLRMLLTVAIVYTVGSTCAYYGYRSWKLAIFIEAAAGFGIAISQIPLYDLASRAAPRGSEAMAYALMMSAWNLGLQLSDVIGSWLFDHYHLHFQSLIWLNAATTAAVLIVIPLLPRGLVGTTERGS